MLPPGMPSTTISGPCSDLIELAPRSWIEMLLLGSVPDAETMFSPGTLPAMAYSGEAVLPASRSLFLSEVIDEVSSRLSSVP